MHAAGLTLPTLSSPEASRMDVLRDLWTGAGLEAIETRKITVERTFADFEEFWSVTLLAPAISSVVAAIGPGASDRLKARVKTSLPTNNAGRVVCTARANAIR